MRSWSALGATLGASVAALLLVFTLVWWVAVRRRNAGIVDVFWGLSIALVAALSVAIGHGDEKTRVLLLFMTSVWGIRLGLHLAKRNLGHPEDPRYAAIRATIGARFDRWSLAHVFYPQAAIAWIVSLPVQVGANLTGPSRPWTVVGYWLWVVGLAFETAGDAQLAAFKRDPSNAGKVMDRGLWRYTRHPNYFGDACVWWGIWLVAAVDGWGAATVVGPVVMTLLLVRVTGKRLLESRLRRSRPGYDDYIARTSGFFPLPPKRGAVASPKD